MRPTLAVLAFIVAFLVVNRLVVARAPLPPESGLRTKTEFLIEHLEDYDAIWIGSSATLYGLRPQVFNEELARLGHANFRVFNMGVGGMVSFETVWVLRRILTGKPKRLAWVFYEEPVFDSLLWYPDIVNQRYIHWHDTQTTLDAIHALQYAEQPPSYKQEQYEDFWLAGGDGEWRRGATKEHAELYLRRELAVGQGPRIYERYFGGVDKAWPAPAELAEADGWMDIAFDPAPGAKKAHDLFISRPKKWDDQIARMISLEASRPQVQGGYDLDSLRQLIAEIRAAGAEPIMYTPQRGLPSAMMMSLIEQGELPALFPFHLSTEYPELIPREVHYDEAHLNREGATIWSKRFAQRFDKHLRAEGLQARKPSPSSNALQPTKD